MSSLGSAPPRSPPSDRALFILRRPFVPNSSAGIARFPRDQPNTTQSAFQGHLRRSTQLDWAVQCTTSGYSSILVFWGGADPRRPSELAVATGADYTDSLPGGQVVFARAIALADSAHIPEPQPVPITHDGIRNIHVGRSSVTYYWDEPEKRWVRLTGPD